MLILISFLRIKFWNQGFVVCGGGGGGGGVAFCGC